jgi:hypothetical protein
MPRKRLKIRVSSTVREEIDPHQVAGVLLDWYAHELKSGRITPTCLQNHRLTSECTCPRPAGEVPAADNDREVV